MLQSAVIYIKGEKGFCGVFRRCKERYGDEMKQRKFPMGISLLLTMALCLAGLQASGCHASAMGKPTVTVGKRNETTAVLQIKKVKKAVGYQVFIANSRKGKFQQMGSTRTGSFRITKLKKNKAYFVKVRAYRTSGSRIITGKYSSVLKVDKYQIQTQEETYIKQVLTLVNEERAKAELSPLESGGQLNEAAMTRAKELAQLFSHTRPDGRDSFTVLTEAGIIYSSAGENIASGQNTPEEVMDSWMNSTGHRANILSDKYTQIGIGYYTAGGQSYWVQLFVKE